MKFELNSATPAEVLANLWRRRNYTPLLEGEGFAYGATRLPNQENIYHLWVAEGRSCHLVNKLDDLDEASFCVRIIEEGLRSTDMNEDGIFGVRGSTRDGDYYVIAQCGTRPREGKAGGAMANIQSGSWDNVRFLAGPYASESVAAIFAPIVRDKIKREQPEREDWGRWDFGVLRKETSRPRSILGVWLGDDDDEE